MDSARRAARVIGHMRSDRLQWCLLVHRTYGRKAGFLDMVRRYAGEYGLSADETEAMLELLGSMAKPPAWLKKLTA